MDEADQLPAGDQARLPSEDRVEQRDVRLRRIGELRVVSRPRVVRKRPHGVLVVVCRRPLHVPTRIWLAATRVSTAPSSTVSR
jgi:hypothetical protein